MVALAALVGCALSIYNFISNVTRERSARSCLLKPRYFLIKIENNSIVSLLFRFHLSNISNQSILLKEISIVYPPLNHGRKIDIELIGKTKNIINEGKIPFKIGSQSLPESSILPYLLNPGSTYEGYVAIDPNKKMVDQPPPSKMIVYYRDIKVVMRFSDGIYKLRIPIKFDSSDIKDKNLD